MERAADSFTIAYRAKNDHVLAENSVAIKNLHVVSQKLDHSTIDIGHKVCFFTAVLCKIAVLSSLRSNLSKTCFISMRHSLPNSQDNVRDASYFRCSIV